MLKKKKRKNKGYFITIVYRSGAVRRVFLLKPLKFINYIRTVECKNE